jgi:DNA-binding CsgD family transcriptional regulator
VRATDRDVRVVAAVVAAGSEKAAAHRLELSPSTVKQHLASARSKVGAETTAQLVWILAARRPEPESMVQTDKIEVGPAPLAPRTAASRPRCTMIGRKSDIT